MVPPSEKNKIETIRKILLQQDREVLQQIEDTLNQPDKLAEKINPIIAQQLDLFQQEFPRAYRLAVEQIIERKLKASQEDLLHLLYPIMGKMIRKYLAQQLQALRESVERQVRQSFFGRIKARLFGVREGDMIISQAMASRVQEAYVIQQHSGLLLGSASATSSETIDKDMLAGMLTAIKAFVQDAFTQNDVDLELINYGDYQILIQDCYRYYIALAVKGQLTSEEKEKYTKLLLKFVEKELNVKIDPDDPASHLRMKTKLQQYFINQH
jgi:hypothetical protein